MAWGVKLTMVNHQISWIRPGFGRGSRDKGWLGRLVSLRVPHRLKGNSAGNPVILVVKTMVSCNFPLKPTIDYWPA